MGRKGYLSDLAAVSAPGAVHGIADIKHLADGEVTFTVVQAFSTHNVHLTALTPDISEYPGGPCFIFGSDDTPKQVADSLQNLPDLAGKTLAQVLATVARHLAIPTTIVDSDGDTHIPDSQAGLSDDGNDDYDDYEEYDPTDNDFDDFDIEDDSFTPAHRNPGEIEHRTRVTHPPKISTSQHPCQDLRRAKEAGFKIGVIGALDPGSGCFVSVSCRFAKLGISDEAMAAWLIEPSEYLVLLLHYPFGYVPFEQLVHSGSDARQYVLLRVCVGSSYRPRNAVEAHAMFSKKGHKKPNEHPTEDVPSGLRASFISRPLEQLLNERLFVIMEYRQSMGFSWSGAELYCNENQGKSRAYPQHDLKDHYFQDDTSNSALPHIVTDDELSLGKPKAKLSFPLVAMQFTLRHFARCTEFCLVCHCRMSSQLDAIKPYVCDSPLCLYQYMSLGLGPSIEHEILGSPQAVDILISFCYESAHACGIRKYPEGLALLIPPVNEFLFTPTPKPSVPADSDELISHLSKPQQQALTTPDDSMGSDGIFKGNLDRATMEMTCDETALKCPVRVGDWVMIRQNHDPAQSSWHCRVAEIRFFPTIVLSAPVVYPSSTSYWDGGVNQIITPGQHQPMSGDTRSPEQRKAIVGVRFCLYRTDFDTLNQNIKSEVIKGLVNLIPSVSEMRNYLLSSQSKTLAGWTDRISPAVLGILRWIVASNRSCIIQIDEPTDEYTGEGGARRFGVKKSEHRIPGMQGWMQFRFAMGAPDKERRFIQAVASSATNKEYPTLFAWHGSPLRNWHSIIRDGLDFKQTLHGRAYGHGCYHGKQFSVSSGYTGVGGHPVSGHAVAGSGGWLNSELKISGAIALSEIVNSPNMFVSREPFYVVAQLDWIQTRFLFVQPRARIDLAQDTPVRDIFPQDPNRIPAGPTNTPLVLPLTAIPKSRRSKTPSQILSQPRGQPLKKLRKLFPDTSNDSPGFSDSDSASVTTLPEDISVLLDDEEKPSPSAPKPDVTPFTPNTPQNLPLTSPPTYATSSTTRRLQKDFTQLLTTQDHALATNTLHELGWYTHSSHLETTSNLYQWLISLHSFPLSLPLAQDMLSFNIPSITLEIRFHHTYPFSPPFIRVVKPRFLPFHQGGGGHVTAGGSICMDLLTNSGWSAISSIESVLLQIRVALMSTDPRPARLEVSRGRNLSSTVKGSGAGVGGGSGAKEGEGGEYGVAEAIDAFKRAAGVHGWEVPKGVDEMARMT